MRIVCISDTHSLHNEVDVPDGDILVHAGDFTERGELDDVAAFDEWLSTLPHAHKFVVAGNHDFCFERQPQDARARLQSAVYLEDSGATAMGLNIWGSPWQPRFFDWAFNLDRGEPLAKKWALIPDDTDIVITHGPPMGTLDVTRRGESVGCQALAERMRVVRPRLHVFGHIHEAYGVQTAHGTTMANASVCNLRYKASNAPIVVDL
jgi:predicted phosphodiesterase